MEHKCKEEHGRAQRFCPYCGLDIEKQFKEDFYSTIDFSMGHYSKEGFIEEIFNEYNITKKTMI